MDWGTMTKEDFHLKSTTISYLENEIIKEFAKVKLISHETKDVVWINPLCLAALSTTMKKWKIDDLEDFEIISEHSLQDLEYIANFCHCGIYPPLSSECTDLFQDFGINILSYLNPVVKCEADTKEGILDVLVEPEIDNEFDDTAEYSDDVESPPSPIVFKRKPGKSRSRDVKSKRKKRKKIEDWDEEEIPDMKEEDEDYLEDKIIRRKGTQHRAKVGRLKKDCSDLIAAEQNSKRAPIDEISNLDTMTLAIYNDFKLPKPLEQYQVKASPDKGIRTDKVKKKKDTKNDQKHACHICPNKYTSEYVLRQHCISSHSQHYSCSHCVKAFSLDDLQGFKFHMFKHEYNGPLKCIQCGFSCYERRAFICHTENRPDIHDNRCTQCDEVLETFDIYQLHVLQRHNGQMMYKCKVCYELFDIFDDLKKHRRVVHNKTRGRKKLDRSLHQKPIPREQTCEHCGVTTRNLVGHYKLHHDKEEALCKDCGKILPNQYKLKAHISYYHAEVTCSQCGEVVTKKKLPRHIQSKHLDISDRKHKCEICGKGFLDKMKLGQHMNIHTGAKPFECKYCGARYNNSSNRDAHVRSVHHGIKRSK